MSETLTTGFTVDFQLLILKVNIKDPRLPTLLWITNLKFTKVRGK